MEKQARFIEPTMATPAPGFTDRVMARIERYERERAQRRALVGAALLLGAASFPFLTVGYLLVALGSQLSADPGALWSALMAFAPVVSVLGSLAEAVYVSASILFQLGSVQMLMFAILVCSLTFLWAYIVHGSFQWSLRTLSVGESR